MASPFDRIGRSDGAGVHAHLLVVSDSHGDLSVLDGCRSRVQERRVDAVVHLGDMGPEDWPDPVPGLGPLVAVAGNTDPAGRRLPGVRVFEAGGLRFVCVHGHLQQVKTSLALLFELAARCQADVVFYGHTHRFRLDWGKTPDGRAVLLANPGSSFGFGLAASAGCLFFDVRERVLTGRRMTGQGETALEIGSFAD
ncbi:MAG: YfcE family phosphodiesterase [Clostridiaceae bacterium]|jgi:putative phosphoesterase|nr:YfcE family phosphodiesterase [Clostridiaceae bacterium]